MRKPGKLSRLELKLKAFFTVTIVKFLIVMAKQSFKKTTKVLTFYCSINILLIPNDQLGTHDGKQRRQPFKQMHFFLL